MNPWVRSLVAGVAGFYFGLVTGMLSQNVKFEYVITECKEKEVPCQDVVETVRHRGDHHEFRCPVGAEMMLVYPTEEITIAQCRCK